MANVRSCRAGRMASGDTGSWSEPDLALGGKSPYG